MNPDTLLDLVNTRLGDTENTEGEIDAIDALLSLGDTCENLIDDQDNAALMPIGAPTGIVDAAPVPILLDQINADNAIANIIDTEENEKESQKTNRPRWRSNRCEQFYNTWGNRSYFWKCPRSKPSAK